MDREDPTVNVRHVAQHDGFDAGLAESFFQPMQERLKGRRPDGVNVHAIVFESTKLSS